MGKLILNTSDTRQIFGLVELGRTLRQGRVTKFPRCIRVLLPFYHQGSCDLLINKSHVNIIMLNVDITKSDVDIIVLHVDINKSHVHIIMLHVDRNKSHVDIILLHVDINKSHVEIIVTCIMSDNGVSKKIYP